MSKLEIIKVAGSASQKVMTLHVTSLKHPHSQISICDIELPNAGTQWEGVEEVAGKDFMCGRISRLQGFSLVFHNAELKVIPTITYSILPNICWIFSEGIK